MAPPGRRLRADRRSGSIPRLASKGYSALAEAMGDPEGFDGGAFPWRSRSSHTGECRGSVVVAVVVSEAEECLGGAQQWVVRRALGNLFATDAVLLVSEGESGGGDCLDVHVIQRGSVALSKVFADVEGDVAEAEGLGASFLALGVGVLCWTEEPVEGNDGEVDDVLVGVVHQWGVECRGP